MPDQSGMIEVTQADRERAARFFESLGMPSLAVRERAAAIRRGEHDGDVPVQAIAFASTAALAEQARPLAPSELHRLVSEFEDFINEPPQYEELHKVRDYRHEAYSKWAPLARAILAQAHLTQQLGEALKAEVANCGSCWGHLADGGDCSECSQSRAALAALAQSNGEAK